MFKKSATNKLENFIQNPNILDNPSDKKSIFHAIEIGLESKNPAENKLAALAVATWQKYTKIQPEIDGELPLFPKHNLENAVYSGKTNPSSFTLQFFEKLDSPLPFPGRSLLSNSAIQSRDYELGFLASGGKQGNKINGVEANLLEITEGAAPLEADKLSLQTDYTSQVFGVSRVIQAALLGQNIDKGMQEANSVGQGQTALDAISGIPNASSLIANLPDILRPNKNNEDLLKNTTDVLMGRKKPEALKHNVEKHYEEKEETQKIEANAGLARTLTRHMAYIMALQNGLPPAAAGNIAHEAGEKAVAAVKGMPAIEIPTGNAQVSIKKTDSISDAVGTLGEGIAMHGLGSALDIIAPGVGTILTTSIEILRTIQSGVRQPDQNWATQAKQITSAIHAFKLPNLDIAQTQSSLKQGIENETEDKKRKIEREVF
jgi:hypothetical protein